MTKLTQRAMDVLKTLRDFCSWDVSARVRYNDKSETGIQASGVSFSDFDISLAARDSGEFARVKIREKAIFPCEIIAGPQGRVTVGSGVDFRMDELERNQPRTADQSISSAAKWLRVLHSVDPDSYLAVMGLDETKTCMDRMTLPVEIHAELAQGWQAVCNGHIGGWYGTCRTSSKDANGDKVSHDAEAHDGTSWAVVVKRTCDSLDSGLIAQTSNSALTTGGATAHTSHSSSSGSLAASQVIAQYSVPIGAQSSRVQNWGSVKIEFWNSTGGADFYLHVESDSGGSRHPVFQGGALVFDDGRSGLGPYVLIDHDVRKIFIQNGQHGVVNVKVTRN